MDLVADMLAAHLPATLNGHRLEVELVRPTMPQRVRGLGRFVNRFWDYPRWLKAHSRGFDVFHVVDHSYAHVVHALPAERTVVTCHDVDAFLPVVAPELSATKLPLALTKHVLSGMRKAARVTCDSVATYDEARHYSLLPEARMTVVPIGTREGFAPEPAPASDAALAELIGPRDPSVVELLHVGSCIPRKRIDLLLRVFATIRQVEPRARLLKAGGTFTNEQRQLAASLGVDTCVTQLPFLEAGQLGALYRRADVLLLTSEREGFGLPLVEAMACGTPVIATDLPVFRETGGQVAVFCAAGDLNAWRDAFDALRSETPNRKARRHHQGVAQANRFSWPRFAAAMAQIYGEVACAASRPGTAPAAPVTER